LQSFYSHGKLLITSEYFVLDGAKALAIPTKKGQILKISESDTEGISWRSYDFENNIWFETRFSESLVPLDSSDTSNILQKILVEAQKLNPEFLANRQNLAVETFLEFPNNWGLGSSSTLINNIAQWANVDAFKLLENSFGGSGYDIAAAQHSAPIIYQRLIDKPLVSTLDLTWNFFDKLFFVHLNKKQNSKDGIQQYRKQRYSENTIEEFSILTNQIINSKHLDEFEKLIKIHEDLISKYLGIQTIKENLFKDYPHAIKSLGAWGGDFFLVVGNPSDQEYFKNRGYKTIVEFRDMIV